MKILVTGGAGDVGKAVVARLVRSGHQVRVFDLHTGPGISGVETVEGDVTQFEALREAARGQERIAHLAGIRSPAGGTAQEIFRVNDLGTFHVYQAAAEEGIHRVACASSICALGYLFGLKEFEIRYFPIDEDHPPFTTDPYSFSKEIVEEIAAYYWRREGISSACLRLTAVPDFSPQTRARIRDNIAWIRRDFGELKALPEPERQARLDRFFTHLHSFRRSRLPGRPLKEWREQSPDLSQDEIAAISWRNHFWTFVHPEDAAQAFERSLLADFEGSIPLHINSGRNMTGLDSELLARTYFPRVKDRERPLLGSDPLISIGKARQVIGYEPEYPYP